jgi:hypothetical protein
MGDSGFTGIPPEVIAMGCAGLATVGLSVLSSAHPDVSSKLRNRLIETVEIVIYNEGSALFVKLTALTISKRFRRSENSG